MLNYRLVHPPLIGALAAAGHGTRILIADGNFPYSSHTNARATTVHLNLRPGLMTVDDVLPVILDAVSVERAVVMDPVGASAIAQDGYRTALPPSVPIDRVERFSFYDLTRAHDTMVVIATADQRLYANLLLTIGLAV